MDKKAMDSYGQISVHVYVPIFLNSTEVQNKPHRVILDTFIFFTVWLATYAKKPHNVSVCSAVATQRMTSEDGRTDGQTTERPVYHKSEAELKSSLLMDPLI